MTAGHEEVRRSAPAPAGAANSPQREQALLDAAVALMDRDDWQTVTVEEIAHRAEYAKGTVYRHFPSKDDLLARLVADWNAGTYAGAGDPRRRAPLRGGAARRGRRLLAPADRRPGARPARPARPARRLPRPRHPGSRAALAEIDARTLGLVAGLIDWGIAEGAIPRARWSRASSPSPRC